MFRTIELVVLLSALFLLGPSSPPMPVSAPHIFCSDLVSGPNSGGEEDKGAFITILGKGFGANRGDSSITVGGGAADNYPAWSDSRVKFQLGPAARTGEIVVHVAGGASNGVPFTVRPGRIFFVAPNGSDSSNGSFKHPWKTLIKVKRSMSPGDITYAMDGVSQTTLDDYSSSLSIFTGGTAEKPVALVAYPGATVTIGATSGPASGIRVANLKIEPDYWVLSGLVLRAKSLAIDLGGSYGYGTKGWRIVGNDISCPEGDGSEGCVEASRATDVKFLGNFVHDVGVDVQPSPSKKYHGVYFSTDSNHIEVGWNVIANIKGCRALQFHSSPTSSNHQDGFNQYDLIVHDNLIHDSRCDGINFATVDPSKGPVAAYNNVIYNAGLGPDPNDDYADYDCIYVPGTVNSGEAGTGTVDIEHNTLYNCGARGGGGTGAIGGGDGSRSPALFLNLRNNIIFALSGERYITSETRAELVRGDHNLFYGAGSGPSFLRDNINANPRFIDPRQFDFHLESGSPAIGVGENTGILHDYEGLERPKDSAHDLGAYQYSGAAPTPAGSPRDSRRRAIPAAQQHMQRLPQQSSRKEEAGAIDSARE